MLFYDYDCIVRMTTMSIYFDRQGLLATPFACSAHSNACKETCQVGVRHALRTGSFRNISEPASGQNGGSPGFTEWYRADGIAEECQEIRTERKKSGSLIRSC